MRARLLLLAAGLLAIAGCATPGEPKVTLTQPAMAPPLDVPAPVSDNPAEGLSENEWGGEVPRSKPAEQVDEGGLGDIG